MNDEKFIETYCHNCGSQRCEGIGTEWFDGNKASFKDAIKYVDGLFYSKGYETCNELRRKLAIKGKNNDNKGN